MSEKLNNKVAVDNLLESMKYYNQVSSEYMALSMKLSKAREDLNSAKATFAKIFNFKGSPIVVRVPGSTQIVRISNSYFPDEIDISFEEMIE
jgi:hypothetical protein